jgi:AraC-like DNA-binding protein
VARVSGFSTAHFSELFKKQEGTTFRTYLLRLRLARAKELLTGTDLSVKRIAELSGYGSPQYLSRVFRRIVGMTPLAYRRKILPDWFRKKRKTAAGP